MLKCKNCGWVLPDDARVCIYCGSPVEHDDEERKRRLMLRWRLNALLIGMQGPKRTFPFSPAKSASKYPPAALIVLLASVIILADVILIGTSKPGTSPTTPPVAVSPTLLDFGKLEVGSSVVLAVTVTTSAELPISWKIDPGNAQWLSITLQRETKKSENLKESIYDVTANTNKLQAGQYTANLALHFGGGEAQQVPVKIQVIPHGRPLPAELWVSPSSLDFGKLNVGSQDTQSLTVSNKGGQELKWKVDKGKADWLTLDRNEDHIPSGGQPQIINVTIDTSNLVPDNYSATLTFTSNGGDVRVSVRLLVNAAPPELSVSPDSLDFGSVLPGEQLQPLILTIRNIGGPRLNWNVKIVYNVETAGWVSVNPSSSAKPLPPGGQQLIDVTTDTSKLVPGNYSATLTFTSNGGNRALPVSLVVKSPQQSPVIEVSPGQLARTDCSYTGQGWNCTAALTNLDRLRSLSWSSSSSGISGVTFTPPHGAIPANQTTKVTVFVPNTTCPASADLVFTGPQNTVHVPWSCQPPTIEVSPAGFNANTDCSYSYASKISNPGWTCQAMVTDADSQLSASWSASATGITFTPANGSVSPGGQPAQVNIFVPELTCPATVSFTFTGSANSVHVSWSCGSPSLTVTPSSINAKTDCSYGANHGWICSVTLSSSSSNQGDLAWSASSSGLSGISFSKTSGTLAPGQSQTIEIFVSAPTVCPATASLDFSGPANTAKVSWSCAAPTLSVNPSSLGPGTGTCQYKQQSDTYTCIVTLSDDQGGASWTAPSNINGVTISPSSGTVYPSGTKVTISNLPCSDLEFSFVGPANTVPVSWGCIPIPIRIP